MLRLELNCAQGTMTLHKNGVRAGQVASGVLPESGGALSWMIMVLNPLAVVRVINASPPPPVQPMASAAAPVAAVAVAAPTEPQVVMAQPVQQVRAAGPKPSPSRHSTQPLCICVQVGPIAVPSQPASTSSWASGGGSPMPPATNPALVPQPEPAAAPSPAMPPVSPQASTCVNHLQRVASGC